MSAAVPAVSAKAMPLHCTLSFASNLAASNQPITARRCLQCPCLHPQLTTASAANIVSTVAPFILASLSFMFYCSSLLPAAALQDDVSLQSSARAAPAGSGCASARAASQLAYPFGCCCSPASNWAAGQFQPWPDVPALPAQPTQPICHWSCRVRSSWRLRATTSRGTGSVHHWPCLRDGQSAAVMGLQHPGCQGPSSA